MRQVYPDSERACWEKITKEDATDAELNLLHWIMGGKPGWMESSQWRENARACVEHIREHVEREKGKTEE